MRFIPLDDEIIGFFQHIPRQIFELLRQEAFLPAIDSTTTTTVWKRPFECVLVKDDESSVVRDVLTPDLLQTHLARFYIHPSLLASTTAANDANFKSILTHLGVHQLTLADIVDILKSALLSPTAAVHDITTTAKWLVVLHHCFNSGTQYSMQQEELFLGI